MKKIKILIAVFALTATASFANSSKVEVKIKEVKEVKIKEKVEVKSVENVRNFPVKFVTSCGTWTGSANCGSASAQECGDFLNAVGDFLESLCES